MIGLDDEEGSLLVRFAREVVETYVKEGEKLQPPVEVSERLKEKRGVFVTLNKLERGEKSLRGCIGFPLPELPLIQAVRDAAISAAVEDPRFEPVKSAELSKILVEVSVLTPPELLQVSSPREYPSKIQVGRDGLVIKWRLGSGLLLPQVPLEYGWDAEEFLCHASMKAGGPPDLWLIPDTKVYTFQAEVFEEVEPRGKVIRKRLG